MVVQVWAPINGWPLADVAAKRGWTVYEVPGATVALGKHGRVYVEGSLSKEALDALVELGLSLFL
jgi:hypothetical protein